jgi:ATP-dependent Lhr-like helicase
MTRAARPTVRISPPISSDPHAWADAWFAARGWSPFPFQRQVWNAYAAGRDGLIHAATGTGKTYAAWWGPILEYLRELRGLTPPPRPDPPPLRVLWVTPLRALAADTAAALELPIRDLGLPWTIQTRTGDTAASVRTAQRRRLPTALVTTPESLSLLLTRPDATDLFADLRCVVVDEWHELLGGKRGVQVELALARLRRWRPRLRTWGLSATLGNLEEALSTLRPSPGFAGEGSGVRGLLAVQKTEQPPSPPTPLPQSRERGDIIRGHLPKPIKIDSIIPERIDRFPWAGHLGLVLLPQVVAAIEESRSTLVFTNTRSQTEQWYQAILKARPDWAGVIALHHGSLDRTQRDWVEDGLRAGTLRCVVCTSSLDLGVDFTPVDRVLHIGIPKGVGRLMQRAGRSGHQPGATSRITCVPTHAFELVETAAVRSAARSGRIESRPATDRPLDVLAQHLVTCAVGGGFRADDLHAEVRTTHAYRNLSDAEWAWALDFVTRGGPTLRAYPDFRRVEEIDGVYRVPGEPLARRHRQSVGTITGDAAAQVRFVRGGKLGTVEESFIARLRPGDRFVFAGRMLELVRVRDLTAWVRRTSRPATAVPRWQGGRMPLSTELAAAVRQKLDDARRDAYEGPEMTAVRPMLELQRRWSRIPAANELLIERLRTREGHHLFFYPFEGRAVHEGLAALFAYRLSRLRPLTFTLAANDYGFELLSPDPAPLDEAVAAGLLRPGDLVTELPASLNAAELARRQFREIARVAGLVFPGPPGRAASAKQLQASSGLFYDVFANYDPENLLLAQARREVLERQLEESRLRKTLDRLAAGPVVVTEPERPTPLAFPLLVDRMRAVVSSEKLADRVRRMATKLEREAG